MSEFRPIARLVRALGVVAATLTVVGFAACTSEDRLPGAPLNHDAGYGPGKQRCASGTSQACGITLGEHAGVLTCYQGVQQCVDGFWGECTDGEIVSGPGTGIERSPLSQFSQVDPLALSAPADCVNNPCDPFCQTFDEQPEGGIEAGIDVYIPRYPWETGRLTDFPGGLVTKGVSEPCLSALDCQFGQRCENVGTAESCSHDKCEVGEAFDSTCQSDDMCVNLICTSNPECCEESTTGAPVACPHEACEVGTEMSACEKSDSCVAAVCAVDSTCCSAAWSKECVEEALSQGAAAGCPTYCDCPAGATLDGDGVTCRMPSTNMTTTTATRAGAVTQCGTLGTGWALAKIETATENTTVAGLLDDDSWIGLSDALATDNEELFQWDDGTVIALSYESWAGGQPKHSNGDCVYESTNERWYTAACSSLKQYVCEGPTEPLPDGGLVTDAGAADAAVADAGPNTWSQECVDAVLDTCSAYCGRLPDAGAFYPSTDGGTESGQCVDWVPGQTTSCASAELVAGPGCGDGFPICNVGNTTAPAGVLFIGYPANSGHMDKYRESLTISDFKNYFECATDQDIEPGECITFTCELLSGNNKEIMVNPPFNQAGTYTPIAECTAHNNWTLWRSGGCQPPACYTFDSGDPIDCSYGLPADQTNLNLANIMVTMTGGSLGLDAGGSDLTQVSGASDCSGVDGFYLDEASDRIVICPDTCTKYQGLGASLDGEIGCPEDPVYGTREYTQIYASDCNPTEQRVQWGYLSYDTTLPTGTSVQFAVRTAGTEAGLTSASWTSVATASGTNDDCAMSGPAPCPVDLFAALGGLPNAAAPYLEFRATLIPSAGVPNTAPSLGPWEITYSCPPDK